MPSFLPVLPECFLLLMILITLLVDVTLNRKLITYGLAQFALLGTLALSLALMRYPTLETFNGQFILDHLAGILKITVTGIVFTAFLYSRDYIARRDFSQGEYYILGLSSTLGMMVMVSAHSLLTLYLGLELLSLPLYTLCALQHDNGRASEAAIKYFVMGAIASAMLLYGMSLLYGVSGSLNLLGVATQVKVASTAMAPVALLGVIFVVAGVVFKLGGAPFHMWVPDVYEGAPNCVAMFISSAPKVAAFGLAVRLLVEGVPDLQPQWQQLLILLAVLSLVIGNIVAVMQTNIKRLLGYSAIAHFGYLALGLIAGTPEGYAASLFYIVTYGLMALGAFGFLTLLSNNGIEAEKVEDLAGLNQRNPWLAFLMLVIMLSMAGVPPLVGFFAKLGVLQALIKAHYVWLAVTALVFAIVGAYYYIRVIKVMYFDEVSNALSVAISRDARLALSVNALLVLGLGIFPNALFQVCVSAFGS